MNSEADWIKAQGGCCNPDCPEAATQVDDMDNVYCDEHAEQDRSERPDNWEDDR
jgi:hypothetical protein